jgi:transposase InsO family protein
VGDLPEEPRPEIRACDVLPVIDLGFRSPYAFFVIALGTRRVIHVGVTRHPTDTRVARQLREAIRSDQRSRFLIRDNDRKYGAGFARVAAASGIRILRPPVRAPRANATCEHFLGSVRHACLDHLLILGERHLGRVLREYVAYFNGERPHQGLGQTTPEPSPAALRNGAAPVRSMPVLGGLHHAYRRVA